MYTQPNSVVSAHQTGEEHGSAAAVGFRHESLDGVHALLVWCAHNVPLLRPPVGRPQVAEAVGVEVVKGGGFEDIWGQGRGRGACGHTIAPLAGPSC